MQPPECMVANTSWSVSAAVWVNRIVSGSRISPPTPTSGSSRKESRSPCCIEGVFARSRILPGANQGVELSGRVLSGRVRGCDLVFGDRSHGCSPGSRCYAIGLKAQVSALSFFEHARLNHPSTKVARGGLESEGHPPCFRARSRISLFIPRTASALARCFVLMAMASISTSEAAQDGAPVAPRV